MMWPYYNDGFSWLWMGGMMILFWGAIILLGIWVVRSTRTRPEGDEAMAILRKRLAAGEISQDDYEKSKRLLQG